jgi:hypothetical protein
LLTLVLSGVRSAEKERDEDGAWGKEENVEWLIEN